MFRTDIRILSRNSTLHPHMQTQFSEAHAVNVYASLFVHVPCGRVNLVVISSATTYNFKRMNVTKEIQRINEYELSRGANWAIKGSWHERYKNSAWIFVGNLDYELTEGDVICFLSQYGEIEDINMPRDDKSGKPKGFAFVKYEHFKSTILSVDNFNGIKLLGRTLRVDHMFEYDVPQKKKAVRTEVDLGEQEYVPGHAYRERGVLAELVRLSDPDARAKNLKIRKGSKVEVRFGGRKIWQPAIVLQCNANDTYDVSRALSNKFSIGKGVDVYGKTKEQKLVAKKEKLRAKAIKKIRRKEARKHLKQQLKADKKVAKQRRKARERSRRRSRSRDRRRRRSRSRSRHRRKRTHRSPSPPLVDAIGRVLPASERQPTNDFDEPPKPAAAWRGRMDPNYQRQGVGRGRGRGRGRGAGGRGRGNAKAAQFSR